MKKIGLIGGVGWPSTVEYYRLIHILWQKRYSDLTLGELPELCVESLNITKSIRLRGSESQSWDEWKSYYLHAFQNLENANCEILAIASVTPHTQIERLQASIKTPIVSIYKSVARKFSSSGFTNGFLLGTKPTMTTPHFKDALLVHGIVIDTPSKGDSIARTIKVIDNLYKNNIESAKETIDEIIRTELSEEEIKNNIVCLGCTELSTAFPEHLNECVFTYEGITYLNAYAAHVEDIIENSLINTKLS